MVLFIYLYFTGYQVSQPSMITVKIFFPFSFDGSGSFIYILRQISQPAMITLKLFSPFSFDGTGAFIYLFIFPSSMGTQQ